MITCKEDLINTYIENDHGELRDLYYEKCKELGISAERHIDWYDWKYVNIDQRKSGYILNTVSDRPTCKKLTLSDLKSRTKVEYELIKFESTGDAYRVMLDGEKLYSQDGESEFLFDGKNFVGIDSDGGVYTLECHSNNEPFFCKVERPVEWFDDAVEFLNKNCKGVEAAGYCKDTNSIAITGHMNQEQCYDFARILLEQEGD